VAVIQVVIRKQQKFAMTSSIMMVMAESTALIRRTAGKIHTVVDLKMFLVIQAWSA
jgi:hypothetical protein